MTLSFFKMKYCQYFITVFTPYGNHTTFLIPKFFSENKPQSVPNIFLSLKEIFQEVHTGFELTFQ